MLGFCLVAAAARTRTQTESTRVGVGGVCTEDQPERFQAEGALCVQSVRRTEPGPGTAGTPAGWLTEGEGHAGQGELDTRPGSPRRCCAASALLRAGGGHGTVTSMQGGGHEPPTTM